METLSIFDNGATSQNRVVIDAIAKYYQEINANIRRNITLSRLMRKISRGKSITPMLNICMKYFRDYIWN
jgi:hypothetical protein